MTFKTAYTKLTVYYVCIIMFLSVAFSCTIYSISCSELDRGLNKQIKTIRDLPKVMINGDIVDFEQIRLKQFEESRNRLIEGLIYFNFLILIFSTIISYLLAKKTLEPIEKMVESQNRFTADASHELKTPLAAMKSEIEVSLRDKKFNLETSKKLLTSNLEEVAKLETLSNALLQLARYKEDVKLSFPNLSIEDILINAYEKIEPLAKEKSINFENNLKDLTLQGDKQSLVELFAILLDNAVKYSPEKSIININVEHDKQFVVIKIKDRGAGIKSSDVPYIFNRFYRADSSRTKEKTGGYGLGLSIAKQIVEMHSGSIEVCSLPSKGSEFIVKLPNITK